MRTTINLPDKLVDEAMKVSECTSKTELFKMALENVIQRNKVAQIRKFKGKVNLNMDLDTLRDRK